MDLMDDEETINTINIAPLVDVCLVLLLVFMVKMPLSALYGIAVKDNVLSKYGITTQQEHVTVMLLTGGGIYVLNKDGSKHAVPYEDFGAVVRQLLQTARVKDVMFRISRDVPHGQAVWALDIAKQNGAEGISLLEAEHS